MTFSAWRTTRTYAIRPRRVKLEPLGLVPHPLPPSNPELAPEAYADSNHQAELALARLSGVSGLVPSVEWLLYGAVRREALLTSQLEGTQATLVDVLDEEAGFIVSNADDVEEVTNYLRAFRLVQGHLRDPNGLPISVRLLCDVHRVLAGRCRRRGSNPASCGDRRTGSAEPVLVMRLSCRRLQRAWPRCWVISSDSSTMTHSRCRRWSGSHWSMPSSKPSIRFSMAMAEWADC